MFPHLRGTQTLPAVSSGQYNMFIKKYSYKEPKHENLFVGVDLMEGRSFIIKSEPNKRIIIDEQFKINLLFVGIAQL